jgi:hypothetical protein
MLKEIKKPNRDHARRVLQCLVVAIRPLRVEELAEVLAVDFEDPEGVPVLKPSWRWEDQEQALLASCSSLIVVVDTGDSRVVQFSHFSVKEFLTSARLSTSSQDIVSRYHIALEPAHTILAQACLSVLLQLHDHDEEDEVGKNAPLARYAAELWVRHAQFEDVASRITGKEYLFDPDKPYFAAWRRLYDIDTSPPYESALFLFDPPKSSTITPLYYAARCGFQSLVEQLIVKYPQHLNATGGRYKTPAVAALAGRHYEIAGILHRNGSSVDLRGYRGNSPLHSAAYNEDLEMVQAILDCGADLNVQNYNGSTPLVYAMGRRSIDPRVIRLLLDRGADPNLPRQDGTTALHQASQKGMIEAVRLLVKHDASVEVKDEDGRTPLEVPSGEQRDEIIKLLLEHRTK